MKRLSLSAVAVFGISACSSFTPNRVATDTGSIGEQVYGAICDRTVAQNIPEDLEGAKYGTVCHKDYYGNYATPEQVENTPYTDPAQEKNRLARARISALGKRRTDLINALNVVLADSDTSFLGSLKTLLTNMAPLYNADIPNVTNSISAALSAIDASQDAVDGLTQVLNHNNYSNVTAGGGLLGVAVSQSTFPTVLDDTYRLFGHGTAGEPALNQLLFALENSAQTQAPVSRDVATTSSSFLGILGNVAVTQNALLEAPGTDNLTATRDACGNAALAIIAAPYVDANGDGCADTDSFGRFIDASGNVINAPTPFVFTTGLFQVNGLDQPLNTDGSPLFQYTNARHTIVANIAAGAQPLFVPTQATVTSALTQLGPAFGDLTSTVVAKGLGAVAVQNFSADTSPMYDLALASAPVINAAATNNFEPFTTLSTVLKNSPQDGARVVRALLTAKNLANADTQGVYVPTSTMWDEINDALIAIADAQDPVTKKPLGLIEQTLDSLATITATSNVTYLADASSALFANKDAIDYNPADLNAPPINLTDPSGSNAPHVPVDRTQLTIGANRSDFQRIIGMLAETHGVAACNKQGATMTGFVGPGAFAPGATAITPGAFDACALFAVPDIAAYLLDTIATNGDLTSPAAQAGKGAFPLANASLITQLVALTSSKSIDPTNISNAFSTFVTSSSGITGLNYFPTPQAMARMMLYRGNPNGTALYDTFLPKVGTAAATSICPLNTDGWPNTDLRSQLRICASPADTLAQRWQGTIFALEANNAYAGLRPLVTPFVMAGREDLLLNLFVALHRHWNEPQDPQRTTDLSSFAYGSGADFASYEPLLSKMFASSTDLFGSLQALSIDLVAAGGSVKIAPLFYSFLSAAQNTALTDRRGYSTTTRNDGTTNSYMTPALLVVQALDEIDARRALDPAGLAVWRTARSQLTDSLFATTTNNGVVQLNNQGLQAALPLLLDASVTELRKQANYTTFVTQTYPEDARNAIESPALEATTTLVGVLHKDGNAEQHLLSLVSGTLDPTQATNFAEVSLSLVNGIATMNDVMALQPVTIAAAGVLDPNTGSLKQALSLLQDTRAIDPNNDMTAILTRMAQPLPGQAATPLSIFSDTVMEVQRADPTQTTAAYVDADTHNLLQQTVSFLTDPQHGLAQLITLIQNRTSAQ